MSMCGGGKTLQESVCGGSFAVFTLAVKLQT